MPDGVSKEKFEECVGFILEQRTSIKVENNSKSCHNGQTYNEVLFKCVILCEEDLVYNGYTDSCTTEFELKYHGFCNEEFESISMERKPCSRERGPDKKSRTIHANSMSNFVQFKDRPEEFTKYLKDVKGVDITGNSDMWKILLIIVGVAFVGFGGLWLYNHYKNGKDNNTENPY